MLPEETFCMAPWFRVRSDGPNKLRPCCEWKGKTSSTIQDYQTSNYMQDVRQRLLDGNKIKECASCWKNEDAGLSSLRETLTQSIVKKQTLNKSIVSHLLKDNIQRTEVISADVKIGNLCNFSCAMCHPLDSSSIYNRWIKSPANEFIPTDPNYFLNVKNKTQQDLPEIIEEVLQKKSLVDLQLLGGEPLMYKLLIQRLTEIPIKQKKRMRIEFLTNGSKPLRASAEKLSDFKAVNVLVSLEGIGDTQDYIRKGSDWNYIENNILEFLEYSQTSNSYLQINPTLQALNLEGFPNLIKWCNKHNIGMGVHGTVVEPDYLGINVVTKKFYNNIHDKLKDSKFTLGDIAYNSIGLLERMTTHNYSSQLKDRFIRFIDWYEQDSKLKFKKVMPKLYDDVHNI